MINEVEWSGEVVVGRIKTVLFFTVLAAKRLFKEFLNP
jgi:hypothetical protein